MSTISIVLHVAAARKLSPIDELQHIDYMVRASEGGVVRLGDLVGEVAMRAQACRGIEAPAATRPPCEADTLTPEDFQEFGLNTAAGDPPLYYFATGVLARFITAISPIDIVDAARLLGSLWIGAALVLLWYLFAEFNIAITRRLTASALLIIAPVTLNSGATVTTDAVLLASGAAVLLAAVRWERGAQSAWVPIGLAALGTCGKVTAVVGSGVAALYLAMIGTGFGVSRRERRPASRRVACGLLAAAGATTLIWLFLASSIGYIGAEEVDMNRRFRVDSLQLQRSMVEVTATLPPTKGPRISEPLQRELILTGVTVTEWLLLGAVWGSVAFVRGRLAALSASVLIVLSALGPMLSVITFWTNHIHIPTPPRYGLAALPALTLLLGSALEKRWILLATAGFVVIIFSYSIALLIGAL